MKTFKIEELQEGMRFSEPVYFEDDNMLLPPNVPLKKKDIERLKKWRVEVIQTNGDILKESLKDKQDQSAKKKDIVDEILGAEADSEVLNLYQEMVKKLEKTFESIKNNEKIDSSEIDEIVNRAVKEIKEKKDEVIGFIILRGMGQTSLAKSSVNCVVLSTAVAQNIKMPNHKIIQLAFAALLHDIGMMKIPQAILEKESKLTDEEMKVMHTHPVHAYQIISKTLKYPEEVGQIAMQHHERWDGKGYPKKLSGRNILLSARILSVCDAFEAMVSVRPYRNSMIGYRAMRQLLNDNSRRFDSEILKIFIKTMGIYPIGSIVLLNDAGIGRVISTHSDAPLRPTVKLIVDSHGEKCVKEDIVVNLMEDKSIFITRAINPQEIEKSDNNE